MTSGREIKARFDDAFECRIPSLILSFFFFFFCSIWILGSALMETGRLVGDGDSPGELCSLQTSDEQQQEKQGGNGASAGGSRTAQA